jgi:hypothetical protein
MNSSTLIICAAGAIALPKVLDIFFGQARRVHKLLTKFPDAEQTSLFLPSSSIGHLAIRPWRVWIDFGPKIEEMKKQGWTYLRTSQVRDGCLTLSGVTLHFIRTDGSRRVMPPNKSRGCVKSADMNFGNDQIFDMATFDETSRRIEWSKNEFSHRLSPEPTAVGACRSAIAVHVASRRWLSFLR